MLNLYHLLVLNIFKYQVGWSWYSTHPLVQCEPLWDRWNLCHTLVRNVRNVLLRKTHWLVLSDLLVGQRPIALELLQDVFWLIEAAFWLFKPLFFGQVKTNFGKTIQFCVVSGFVFCCEETKNCVLPASLLSLLKDPIPPCCLNHMLIKGGGHGYV